MDRHIFRIIFQKRCHFLGALLFRNQESSVYRMDSLLSLTGRSTSQQPNILLSHAQGPQV